MCKYLITGAAGFIGSCMVRMLVKNPSTEILTVDSLTYAGNVRSLPDSSRFPNHQIHIGSICDRAFICSELTGFCPDIIIHLAAESHVDRSIDEPVASFQKNIGLNLH